MSLEQRLAGLPPGFEVLRGSRGVLAVRREWQDELARAAFGPDDDGSLARSDLAGRRALFEIALPSGTLLVRRFRHGGLLRGIQGERYFDAERVFRELELSQALTEAGIETPLVVAARARRLPSGGWCLDLVTRRIEGAIDGLRALERTDSAPPALRARLFAEAGRFVARLHAAGLFHADLTPRNLLLDARFFSGEPARFLVLDLDRSRIERPLSAEARRRNLARLTRFLLRRRSRGECRFSRTDLRRFLGGYAAAGGAVDPSALWQGIGRSLRRTGWIHRLGWRLEERAGGGPEARDGRTAGKGLDK